MRLLLTRPAPDNARTAAALVRRGHSVLSAPVLRIEPIAADPGAGPFAGLLLTSANGARAIAHHPRRAEMLALPVLAVGEATATAARAAGFETVESAAGDAEDLMRLAVARFVSNEAPAKTRVLLYIAGADRSRELAVELAPVLGPAGLTVRTVIGYRAVPVPLAEPALAALRGREIDAVVHFSRRSARFYLDGAAPSGAAAVLSPMHYCIAAAVADILREAGATRVTVAQRPEEAALLDAIG